MTPGVRLEPPAGPAHIEDKAVVLDGSLLLTIPFGQMSGFCDFRDAFETWKAMVSLHYLC
jgi:hypothetical protein